MLLELTSLIILSFTSLASGAVANKPGNEVGEQSWNQKIATNTPTFNRRSKIDRHALRITIQTCKNTSRAARSVAACTRLLKNSPPDQTEQKSGLYVHRGNAYLAQKNYDMALSDFDKAVEINPQNPRAYFFRGAVFSQIGKHRRAISQYGQAINLKPDFVEAYFNRGTAYGRLQKFQNSVADLSTVIGFNPKLAKAYANRGTAHAWMQHMRRAFDDYNMAIKLNPRQSAAHINRAAIYRRQGNHSKALIDYIAGFKVASTARVKALQKRLQKNEDYRGNLDGVFDLETKMSLKLCLKTHSTKIHKL